jgi:antitoxin HicB
MANRSTDDYLRLPYTIEVYGDDSDGKVGYVARVIELPGCLTQADNFAELDEMIADAMRAWIETAIENGQAIPEPQTLDDFSGKFVVRIPRSLHRQLSERANREGVSLNALVSVVLAQYSGTESISSKIAQPASAV